jgi:hypothetical protein
MIVNLTFIENILKNINSFENWAVDLDEFGNPKESGSFEFELTDSEFRLWAGRIIKSGDEYELVEFFPKMFHSDYQISDWEWDENEPDNTDLSEIDINED